MFGENTQEPTMQLKVCHCSFIFLFKFFLKLGWHSKLNRTAGRIHLNLWFFVELLKKEEISVRGKCAQIFNGIDVSVQKAKYRRINERLRAQEDKLIAGEHSSLSFLSAVSNLLC